jgi:formylglycine-generating enzyme required for sulfatase activity
LHVNPATDPDTLTAAQSALLNDKVVRLKEAWQGGGAAIDLAEFLPPADSPLRLPCLRELIKAELEIRWSRKLPVHLEDYLARFPELGPLPALPTGLLYEEYRVRHLHGDSPPLDAYRARFPEQFEGLRKMLRQRPVQAQYATLPPPALGNGSPAVDATRSLPPEGTLPAPATAGPPPAGSGDEVIPSKGYTIGAMIGSGQFGVVYRAQAPGGVEVAVKRIMRPLSDEMSQRELRSLELIRRLRHAFLLQTHAYWSLQDRLIIVMELADDSLEDWLKECKAAGLPGIPPAELIAYFTEAAEALDFLHNQQLMHRDVKPANLLRLRGHAKVADFGLVRLQEEHLAEVTMMGGTPVYMPPEVWRNQVSVHSDQYSLAVAYGEVRLGRRIFRGATLLDLADEHRRGTPDLGGLGPAERDVLLRALAKDPDRRFPSCREFLRALSEAVLPARPAPAARPSRRAWVVAALAALALPWPVAYFLSHPAKPTQTGPAVPPEPAVWVPPGGYEGDDPGAKVVEVYGRPSYTRLRLPLGGADPLVFLLVERARPSDPPPFYILRDKVSAGQFAALLADPRMEQLLRKYGAKPNEWTVQGAWRQLGGVSDPARAKRPQVGVTPTEAHCFAECLGGRLPRAVEWDKAGGGLDGETFAFKNWRHWQPKDGGIAITAPDQERLADFQPVGTSANDESLFGCRDMAGNGFEWTCDVPEEEDGQVPLRAPDPNHTVQRRGHPPSYREPFPFPARPLSLGYGEASPNTGFRVVLPIN